MNKDQEKYSNLTTKSDIVVKPKAKMGRPTKLTPEVVIKAWQYVNASDNMSVNSLLPTVERLALIIDVNTDTLYDWSKTNDEFSDILRRLKQQQADKLLQNGLAGRYNPVITKLMLSKHGYVERSEQDTNIKLVNPILSGMSKKQAETEVIDVHSDTDDV